ncbi:YadA family autotransporter adhesin [Burkholderia oklahomensis]|uniref:YadA family autotransporter adhesin n=1 Tax=Burkholderia oklahomensis TaxID=342113 RepID=UPI000D35E57E|nr:YadA-like family protein [Burkholderia oklahomensis]MBI0359295.1 YadA-like family protein [Burkholderia oklahomensis]
MSASVCFAYATPVSHGTTLDEAEHANSDHARNYYYLVDLPDDLLNEPPDRPFYVSSFEPGIEWKDDSDNDSIDGSDGGSLFGESERWSVNRDDWWWDAHEASTMLLTEIDVPGGAGVGHVLTDPIRSPCAAYADSAAVGTSARTAGDGAIALGMRSGATGERAIALGADAAASGVDSVALGAGSLATRDNTVSVGRSGGERQIVHVAPGTKGTDAVNVNQLNSALTTIGLRSDRRFGDLQRQIDATARSAYSGVAAVTALTMIPDVDRNKTLSIGIGVGSYKGCHAIALGGTAWLAANLKIRTGIGLSSEGKTVGVGASWQH